MASLLDGVKNMMTEAIVGKVAGMIGIENKTVTSAISRFLPAIIGGLISKGGTESGAGGLLDIFKSGGYGDDNLKDLGSVFGNKDQADGWLEKGGDLLGTIFGDKQGSVLDAVLGKGGVSKAGGSMLMKVLAPIVINKVAGMVFKNGWGAKKLSSYLGDQKSSIAGLVPGLGALGFADGATEKVASAASAVSATASRATGGGDSGGGGSSWWKWLLPLLIGAGLLWYLTKDGCNTASTDMDTTEVVEPDNSATTEMKGTGTTTTTTTDTKTAEMTDGGTTTAKSGTVDYATFNVADSGDIVDGSGTVVHSGGSYGLDANGNLVDGNGKILIAAGSIPSTLLERLKAFLGQYSGTKLSLDDSGNLVDGTGKVVVKAGDFTEKNGFYYDKDGNKLGRIWSKIVKAVTDAVEKTADAMKGFFTDMVTKKAGAKTEYALSDIKFNPENGRISSFSKAEVEGLAAALQANADGKIVVRAFTNDGKNDKENGKLSKTRAQVVHDMLVTLGVPKGQISFDGEGSGDNRVEIKVK